MTSPPRTLGYYAASAWFQGGIFLLVCAFVGFRLLGALDDAQERGEKLAIEITVRNMRSGMQLAMGDAMMHQREGEIASWVGSDPTRWLGGRPDGYRGECSVLDANSLPAGAWCFEREHRELVYWPRNVEHLRILATADGRPAEQLRWRVTRAPESAASGGFVGLRVEIVTPYEWFLD
jgi:hypothetical protein